MDYSQFKTPYISSDKIRKLAESARSEFWGNETPVDIEKVLMKLKINIIPINNLLSYINFDSFISSDWKNVYVDNNAYCDDFKYRRVRFSMAHELGHLILHKEIYKSLEIKSLEDYYRFYKDAPGDQYSYLETQANSFAGYFLVPRNVLLVEKEKLIKKLRAKLEGSGAENADLTEYIIEALAEQFNVSPGPIRIALQS